MAHLKGLVALITGGAQGMGEGFARKMLENGIKVALIDMNGVTGGETLEKLKKVYGNDVIFIKADVTNKVDFEKAFTQTKEQWKRVDIVVNNAGMGETPEKPENWEKVIDVNLKGAIIGTQLALNLLVNDKGRKGGIVINVSSAGGLTPQPLGPVYAASKAGVIMYSRSIAAKDVKVYTLCPGFVKTAMLQKLKESSPVAKKAITDDMEMTVDEVSHHFFEELLKKQPASGKVLSVKKTGGTVKVKDEYPSDKDKCPTTPTATDPST